MEEIVFDFTKAFPQCFAFLFLFFILLRLKSKVLLQGLNGLGSNRLEAID